VKKYTLVLLIALAVAWIAFLAIWIALHPHDTV